MSTKKNADFLADLVYENELYHHGILGQKWGIRRFQNKDGSLTDEGRRRYLTTSGSLNEEGQKKFIDLKNGKYHDLTKYSRKLALLGAPIDLVRLSKATKQAKENERKVEKEKETQYDIRKNTEYADEMIKSGWKTDATIKDELINLSNYGGVRCEKTGKFGDRDVKFRADYSSKSSEVEPELANLMADEYYDKYQKQYKKVLSTTKEQIARQYYDSGVSNDWNGPMTREEFKNKLKPSAVNLKVEKETPGGAEIVFYGDNDFFSYHILSTNYNIESDKADYTTMDG